MIEPWLEITPKGCRGVADLAAYFLGAAARQGVKHAILGIDNDGGSKTRPEHEDSHSVPRTFDKNDTEGCRECWVASAIQEAAFANAAVVVPVQTIETWLLALADHRFQVSTPEMQYDRRHLKRALEDIRRKTVGPRGPTTLAQGSAKARVEFAEGLLQRPGALDVLRQRRSFSRFEARLLEW